MQVCCVVYVHVWERHYGSVVGVEGGGGEREWGEGGSPLSRQNCRNSVSLTN